MTVREAEPAEQNKDLLGPRTLELLDIQNPEDVHVITPWYHSGGETYCTDFTVRRRELTEHLIAKACIKFSPREAMQEWLGRRRLLETAGIVTPKIQAIDGATIVEEFIPFRFGEAFALAEPDKQAQMRSSFLQTVMRIHEVGFAPLSLHDVRSHGDDVVLIDFGSDLGPPYAKTSGLTSAVQAENFFRQLIK